MIKTEEKKLSVQVFEIIRYGLILLLIFKGFAEMAMTESVFYYAESHYGILMWRGIACISLSVLLGLGFNVKKVINWIVIALYFGISLAVLLCSPLRTNSWDLWRWQLYRTIAIGAVVPLISNAILEKKLRIPNIMSGLFMGFLFLFGLLTIIFNYDRANIPYFIFIIFAYSNIILDKKKLNNWALLFIIAVFCETIYICLKGVFSPDSFGVMNAYYYGIFKSAPRFGEFVGYGAVCAISLFTVMIRRKNKNVFLLFLPILAIAPVAYFLLKINVRNPFLGLGLVLLVMFYIIFERYNMSGYYIAIVLFIALIILAASLVGFAVLSRYPDLESLKTIRGEHPILFRLGDMVNRLVSGEINENDYKVFRKGSFMYLVDTFTSRRISLAVLTVKNLGVEGNKGPLKLLNLPYKVYPHNTFLEYLYEYGTIIGTFILCAIILPLVESIRGIKRIINSKKADTLLILSLFWYVYCTIIFFNEGIPLFRTSPFICLLLGSMIVGRYSKKIQKNDKKISSKI